MGSNQIAKASNTLAGASLVAAIALTGIDSSSPSS